MRKTVATALAAAALLGAQITVSTHGTAPVKAQRASVTSSPNMYTDSGETLPRR